MKKYSILIILLTAFAVYFNALFNGFVYDDEPQVLANRWIRDPGYIPEIFLKHVAGFESGYRANYYRPLMHIIYMFNYHIFGLTPWGFHLVNILFHGGVCILVFLVIRALLENSQISSSATYLPIPFIGALLFAVHPIHTEAVTWIAGIPDLSFTFFYLLSLYYYILSRENIKSAYLFSVLSFFIATLSKEPALTLPIILVAYDYAFQKGAFHPLGSVKRYAPYFMVISAYFILRFHAIGGFSPIKRHSELSIYQCFINAFPLFSQYLGKLLLPVNLNAFYVFHPVTSLFDPSVMISFLVMFLLLLFLYKWFKKKGMAFFSLLLIVVSLAPVLYIPALGENTFAERYLYLPSFGFVMLLSLFITWSSVKKPKNAIKNAIVPAVFLSALFALYSIGTISRNQIWRDNYTLWTDAVKKSPDGAIPHSFLADTLLSEKGKTDEAIGHYQIALGLEPTATIHNNLGFAYSTKGWIDKAIGQYQIALRLEPNSAETYNNLGIAYKKKGLIDNAIECYQIALRLRPNHPGLHYNLANSYELLGLKDKAEEHRRMARVLESKYQ